MHGNTTQVLTVIKMSLLVQLADKQMNSLDSQNPATNLNVLKCLGIRKTFPGHFRFTKVTKVP